MQLTEGFVMGLGDNIRRLAGRRLMERSGIRNLSYLQAAKQIGAEQMAEMSRKADTWAVAAIAAAKARPDNPHGDDDEAIAGMLVTEMDDTGIRRDDLTN